MKKIFLGTCLIFLSCCATSDDEGVKYFIKSDRNCSLNMCRIGKDESINCNIRKCHIGEDKKIDCAYKMAQTKYVEKSFDENSLFFSDYLGNKHLTNGFVILSVSLDDKERCFNKKTDSNVLETQGIISERLKKQKEKWAQEDEYAEIQLKEEKSIEEKIQKDKEERHKQQILKSKNVVEGKLVNANIKFSDISSIINDLSAQPEKDEFETTAEYEKRLKTFKDKKIKKHDNLIFKYNLTTEYDADNEKLYIFVENNLRIDFKKETSKYIARNAFNAEALVTRTDTYEKNIIIDTDFSKASEFHKGNPDRKLAIDYLVIKDVPAKKAKTLSKKLDLIVVGKLKDTEILSHTDYREPKINSPYEWNKYSSSIKVAVSGICVVNRVTNKCMIAFEPD